MRTALILLALSFACDQQKAPKATGGPEVDQACLKEKRPMLDACTPTCEADESLQGAAFDKCLDDCAQKKFGKPIPMCTRE